MDLLGRLTIAFGVDFSDLDTAGGRLKEIGGQFTQLGAIVTAGITLPIAALGGAALKTAIDFETAMVAISKTVEGPPEAIDALGVSLKNLSEATGTSVTELARIGEIAGQMGIAVGDIDEFTETIAALGVATELSTEAAAEGLAKFSNVMGTSVDDVDRLGSSLVALGNAGSSSEAQILEMAQRIVAAGNQVGLAESEVLAFASSLSDLGIDAEAGGSAISKLFLNMQADVATGGGALKQFAAAANLSVADFSDLFRRDAAAAVVEFVQGLGAMDKESGETIVALEKMGITEVRLRNAVLSLAAGHDVLTGALETGATGWDQNTALMAEAQKFYDSTGQRLKALGNQVVNIASELGTVFLPALNGFITVGGKVLDVVRVIVQAFDRLPEPIKIGTGAFLGLLAAWGPVLVLAGGLVTAWGAMATVAVVLGTTVGTVAAVFFGLPAVLAVVIAAGVAIVKNWDTIKAAALELLGAVRGKFESFAESVGRAWDSVRDSATDLASTVVKRFDALAGSVKAAFSAIGSQLKVLTEPLAHLGRAFVDLGVAVGDVLQAIAGRVGQILRPALDLMGSLFQKAAGVVGTAVKGLATLVGDVLSGIAGFVGNVLAGIVDRIRSVLGAAFSLMADLFRGARDVVVAIVVGMVQRILAAMGPLGSLVEFVADGLDGVTGLFRKAADVIVGHSIVPDMVDAIGSNFGRLEPLMVGPSTRATTGVKNVFATLANERPGTALVTNVGAEFARLPAVMVEPAERAVADVAAAFANAPPLTIPTEGVTGFEGVMNRARGVAAGFVAGLQSDFSRIDDAVVAPAKRAAEQVTEAFASIVSPKRMADIEYRVSIDPTQLYASLIAASATTSQKLNLIGQASTSLTNTLQSQIDAANNEQAVREAHTAALEFALERQRLLSLVVGETTLAYKGNAGAVVDSNIRHDALSRTLALANESTRHLTETQVRSATLGEQAWAKAGALVGAAGSNLMGAFDAIKTGGLALLERFTPLGIAGAAVTRMFERLEPVLRPFEAIIDILADVLAAAIVPVLRVLFPIIKLLAIAFTFVGEVVYRVAQGFLLVIGNVVKTIGKLIDALPFVSGAGIIRAGENLLAQADAMGDAARAMNEARDALKGLSFDMEPETPTPGEDEGIGGALDDLLGATTENTAAVGGALGDVLTGVNGTTDAVGQNADVVKGAIESGTKVQKETAAHTEAAVIAIKEEAGILTSLRDVAAAGFTSVVSAVQALSLEGPVVNVTVPEGAEGAQITVEAPRAPTVDLGALNAAAGQALARLASLEAATVDGLRSVSDAVLGLKLDAPVLDVSVLEGTLTVLSVEAAKTSANTGRGTEQAELGVALTREGNVLLAAIRETAATGFRSVVDTVQAIELGAPQVNVNVEGAENAQVTVEAPVIPPVDLSGLDFTPLTAKLDQIIVHSARSAGAAEAAVVAFAGVVALLGVLSTATTDGFRTLTSAVQGLQIEAPAVSVTVGEEVLLGLTASAAELVAQSTRAADQAEAAALTNREEATILAQSLAVQVEIRDAIREGFTTLTGVLEAKDFSPVINVTAGGGGEDDTEAVTPDLGQYAHDDRGLGQSFDMMERYSGKAEI